MAVAHDILEHFPGGTDQPHDEFLALGAMVVIRAMYGMTMNSHLPVEQHTSSDFPEIMRHVLYENMYLRIPRNTKPPHCEETHSIIEKTIAQARKNMLDGEHPEFENADDREQIPSLLESARGWMRIGAARARKRFRNYDMYQVFNTFVHIEKEADRLLKHAEEQDELHVKIVGLQTVITHQSVYDLHPEEY